MKVRKVQNKEYYILTNFAASGNPLFLSNDDVNNFKSRISSHLQYLCTIVAGCYRNDQYKILVLLESREEFVKFYRKKKRNRKIAEEDVPESTYILSDELRNIQSGYALWFNHKYGRFGTVFGRRFTKIWIQSRKELSNWIKKLSAGIRYWVFNKAWSYRNCYWVRKYSFEEIDERLIPKIGSLEYLRGRLGNSP